MKKLRLNKEKIAGLTSENMNSINGGGSNNSTDRTFTCCWCTDTDSDGGGCVSQRTQSCSGPDSPCTITK